MASITSEDIAISIKSLTKLYSVPRLKTKRAAVRDLTLDVPSGEIFGFLGTNGAGKTTTIKIILNFIEPTDGAASLFGVPCGNDDARIPVGYVPEQPYFPKFLTTLEVVKAHGSLSGFG